MKEPNINKWKGDKLLNTIRKTNDKLLVDPGDRLLEQYNINGDWFVTIETFYGAVVYYKNGSPHRENGPAIIDTDGGHTWMYEGQRHRTKGPAIVEPDGTKEWWTDGHMIKHHLPKHYRR